jgi:hypothetical protein
LHDVTRLLTARVCCLQIALPESVLIGWGLNDAEILLQFEAKIKLFLDWGE